MRIRTIQILVLVAAGLIGLAGCAASPEFGDAGPPDKPAAANSDITGSIPMPPSAQPAAAAQLPPPAAAEPFIILGVGY